FPSYWNVVAFYLLALGWPPALNALVVVLLSIGVFVPLRYLYPSRTPTLRPLTVGLGLVWGAAVLVALWIMVRGGVAPRALVVASLASPVYSVGLSLVLDLRRGRCRAMDLASLAAGVLHRPDPAPPAVTLAADELTRYLGRMVGATPRAAGHPAPGGAWLCLAPPGVPPPARALGAPPDAELAVTP